MTTTTKPPVTNVPGGMDESAVSDVDTAARARLIGKAGR